MFLNPFLLLHQFASVGDWIKFDTPAMELLLDKLVVVPYTYKRKREEHQHFERQCAAAALETGRVIRTLVLELVL